MFWALFVLGHDWYAVRSSSRPWDHLSSVSFLGYYYEYDDDDDHACKCNLTTMHVVYVMYVLMQWSRELLGQPDAQQRGRSSPPLLHPHPLPWMVCSSIRSMDSSLALLVLSSFTSAQPSTSYLCHVCTVYKTCHHVKIKEIHCHAHIYRH